MSDMRNMVAAGKVSMVENDNGEQTNGNDPSAQAGGFSLRRLWPLAVVALAFVLFFALDLDAYLTFEALKQHRTTLTGWVQAHALLAALVYMALYALQTAFSLPGGALLTLVGGFLFGSMMGTAMVVVAATIGATALFVAAKTAFGDYLYALVQRRAGATFKRLDEGFRADAFNYLLVLRLVPLFPFFVVNLVPAFLGVRLRTFVVATFVGIIPGTFVFSQVGSGIGSIFDRGESFTLAGVLTPEITIALVGLAVLSLVPVVYKKWKAGRRDG